MAPDDIPQRLRSEFRSRFGAVPLVVRAPARVNLIGEHTDYNDGFVLPAAIDLYTWAAIAPRSDNRLVAHSLQFPEILEADLRHLTRLRRKDWTDYCWGVAISLHKAGVPLGGANLLVSGNVPIGAGLSSSASLEVAIAFALCAASRAAVDLVQLARICQRSENDYVGARCGIMDQFVACLGQKDHALLLDCRSLDFSYAPLPPEVALVICNSMLKHSIAAGEYNQRRAECEQAVRWLAQRVTGIRALRDISVQQLEELASSLPPELARRCRHVVSENARVQQASAALAGGDLQQFGRLMRESHASLRDDFQVSCRELDLLVELALRHPGTVGARMTGGGFGGCTVNLVRKEAVADFRAAVEGAYESATGLRPEVYITAPCDGVQRIE